MANGTISMGGTANAGILIYTGAGETSDRVINLAGTTGGATIEMDGTGPLVLTSAFTATGVGAKTLTLQGSSTAANEIAGKIVDSSSGATTLTKAQAGTWVLGGANTYSGNTTVSAGTLRQGAANVIPSGTGKGTFAVSSGATFDLGGYNSTLNNAATAGTINNATGGGTPALTIGANNTAVTISGQIKNTTGTLSVVKTGTGAMTLSGANTYAGGTTINGGAIVITLDGNLGATTGTLTLNCGTGASTGTGLHFNAAGITLNASRGITLGANGGCIGAPAGDTETNAGVITGTGNFQSGFSYNSLLGTNVLTAANTYSGTTIIAAGRLLLGSGGSLPSGTPMTIEADNGAGAVFDLGGNSQTIGPLASGTGLGGAGPATPTVVFSGGALTIQETSSSTFAGQFVDGSAAGSLTLGASSTGTLTLTKASAYTGGTIINGGTLDGNVAGSIPGNVTVNSTSGTALELDSATAMSSGATLNLPTSPAAGAVYLNLSGGTQTIGALNFGATSMAQGTWGAIGSGAAHQNAAFTGSGLLNVTTGGATPTVAITSISPSPVCAGSTISLTATVSGGNSPSGSVQFFSGATSLGTQPLSGGTATLTGVSAYTNLTAQYLGDSYNNPSTSPAVSATVNARPTAVVSDSVDICSGDSATLSAALTGTGPWNVTWSDSTVQNGVSSSTATRSVSPSAMTTYTVTALSDANCTAQAGDLTGSAVVSLNVAPSISTQPANQAVCDGSMATFSVTATGSDLNYSWAQNNNSGWGNAWSASGGGTTFLGDSTANDSASPCTSFSAVKGDINSPVSGYALGLSGGAGGRSRHPRFPIPGGRAGGEH